MGCKWFTCLDPVHITALGVFCLTKSGRKACTPLITPQRLVLNNDSKFCLNVAWSNPSLAKGAEGLPTPALNIKTPTSFPLNSESTFFLSDSKEENWDTSVSTGSTFTFGKSLVMDCAAAGKLVGRS